jgi:predicted amidohydrolase
MDSYAPERLRKSTRFWMNMRIGLLRIRCEQGAVGENLTAISRCLAETNEHRIDILGLPEMSINGHADPNR